jgi:dimethylamine corrinoid protein
VNGFEVHDLGKDLPSMSFIDKAQEMSAAIIALSSLMTTTRPAQKDVIDLLKGMGLRNKFIVMVGGAPTTKEWAEEIGADSWAETAEEAVTVAQRIMKERKK